MVKVQKMEVKSLRVSEYNLYFPYKNCEYIFMHGLSGAIDLVDRKLYIIMQEAYKNITYIDKIDEKTRQQLILRGYLTYKTKEEEYKVLTLIAKKKHESESRLLNITFLPTYNCNFRCVYCYEQKLNEKGSKWINQTMDGAIVDAVFAQIDKWAQEGKKVGLITLFGGEPLLGINHDIVQHIVENAARRKINIIAISNGYDLRKYDDLLGEDAITGLQITLDGPQEDHDKRRFLAGGQATFQRICENIDFALNKGISIYVRTNINKQNLGSIDKLLKLYKEKKWSDNPKFKCYFKATHKCYEQDNNIVDDLDIMKKLSEKYKDISMFSLNNMYSAISESLKFALENNFYTPVRGGYCGANSGMFTIDPFGDVYACYDVLGREEHIIGNVNCEAGTIELNDNNLLWRGRQVDNIKQCKKCKYALFCGGGCVAHTKMTSNDMKSPNCADYQTIFNEVVPQIFDEIYSRHVN